MSQQRRIDEFFKVVSNKRTSGIVIKTKECHRSTPYSRNRKKGLSLKRKVESNSVEELDSTIRIIYENINNSNSSSIEASPIKKKIQNNKLLQRENVSDNKNVFSSIRNTMDTVRDKLLDSNETYLEISTTESESSLYISKMSPNNENVELMKSPTNKHKRNNSLSPAKSSTPTNSTDLKGTAKKEPRTPKNNNSGRNFSSPRSGSSPKKSNYSPKMPSGKSPTKIYKPLFDDNIKNQAIEHMNLAKQGAISYNYFNLEEIYSKDVFHYRYNPVNTKTSVKYESSEIISPIDLHSKILFTTIFTVLSNPINCGYFDESELDFIYSIITLPTDAQTLLARMIKRKRAWFRRSNINYPEIASDLKEVFTILVSRSMCTFDIENANLSTILELLQVDEIRQLCQAVNIKPNANKKSNVCKLLKLSNTKSLFPGAKSPSTVLYSSVTSMLDYCVCVTDKTWNVIDKILTLLIPNQDPQITVADTFFTLCDIYLGKVMFPNIPDNRFPIFSCNLHLMSYIKAKATLSTTLQLIEKKKWTEVQDCGKLAINTLSGLLEEESSRLTNSSIPVHVKRYMPAYIWLKILSACIDAFKKDKDKTRVVEVLRFLLKQDCYILTKKGKWYAELALIEMYHHKNLEASASVIMEALSTEYLTRVDKVELIERANKILKKKNGLKSITKVNINKVLDEHVHQLPKHETASNVINAILMPENGVRNKSIWCIKSNDESRSYGSVELVALHHYYENGYYNGLHCEGSLAIILFFTLFWEEVFEVHIPGVFVSQYQCAPDDLFTEQFYKNRKEKIDMKFEIVSNLDCIALSIWMEKKFEEYKQYQSIMPANLLKDSLQLKEIVYCLGVQGVIGICRRLVENFKLWRAGFPDLIVWNFQTKKHKIVEVKGPRDSLSIKQRLWLEYLNQLGLTTELCIVEAK